MIVERLAQVLGVLSYTNEKDLVGVARKQGVALIEILGAGGVRIWTPYAGPRDVDEGTALIFLLARASGLRLDVGRCPACVKRGGSWEWAYGFGTPFSPRVSAIDAIDGWVWDAAHTGDRMPMSRPCPECSESGPLVACKVCHGRGSQVQVQVINVAGHTIRQGDRVPLTVKLPAHVLPMFRRDSEALTFMGNGNDRPCHDCNETGKQPGPPQPTGRRILGAEAILEAMPRERDEAERNIAFGTERPLPEFVALGGCGDLVSATHAPGDQTVRDALAVHADRLQADGDPLGELLAAWLMGRCQTCDGVGEEPPLLFAFDAEPDIAAHGMVRTKRRPATPSDPGWPAIRHWEESDTSCFKCNGRGTVLGALWPALEALAAKWCERLENATTS